MIKYQSNKIRILMYATLNSFKMDNKFDLKNASNHY